jgi:hypothetical protein
LEESEKLLHSLATMKLDAKAIRYLTSEDFRVLAAVLIGPSSSIYPAMFSI